MIQTHIVQINQPVIGIRNKTTSLSNISSHSTELQKTTVFSGNPDELVDQIIVLENALQISREESFRVGYEEGKEAGIFEMNQKFNEVSTEFAAMVSSLRSEFDKAMERMETPLVRLSIRIAEKILGTELTNQKKMIDFLSRKVQDMLKKLINQNKLTIHINHERLQWMNEQNIIAEFNVPVGMDVNIVEDDHLQPGECLLETNDFIVENTFRYQLEILEDQILEDSGDKNVST